MCRDLDHRNEVELLIRGKTLERSLPHIDATFVRRVAIAAFGSTPMPVQPSRQALEDVSRRGPDIEHSSGLCMPRDLCRIVSPAPAEHLALAA